jgi:hypothetical protein
MPPTTIEETNRLQPENAPGSRIRAEPWTFIGLGFALGIAAGLTLKFKPLRKALRFYLLARRWI